MKNDLALNFDTCQATWFGLLQLKNYNQIVDRSFLFIGWADNSATISRGFSITLVQ